MSHYRDRPRRLRRFAFSPTIAVEIAKHGPNHVAVVDHALPEDATAVHATFDPQRDLVWVFVESETFDLVEELGVVPEHPRPTFRYDH